MSKLDQHPQVAQLAKELGLDVEENWLEEIQRYARSRVEELIQSAPVSVSSLHGLLQVLAERLSVSIEYVQSEQELERIAEEYGFSLPERKQLFRDLNDVGTDGLLIRNPDQHPGNREFLAVVDARGEHASRAYFTAWHEIAHLIVTPPQRAFEGVYRTISVGRQKDPEESVVDAVAGELAFYEPLVQPVVEEKRESTGSLTWSLIEEVRGAAAPDASFYATAIACTRLFDGPALLLEVDEAYKSDEQDRLDSPQGELELGSSGPDPTPKVRAVEVIRSDSALEAGLSIFKNMRIPKRSVLYEAYEATKDTHLEGIENQSWWETSDAGPRPPLKFKVEAVRRGSYVYGLITPV